MRHVLTKLGIIAGLLGAISLSAAGSTLAKPHRAAATVEKVPQNYTCEASWFYPGYYCYQPTTYYYAYDFPGYYTYGSCTAAAWNGWQWVRTQVC